MNKKIDLFLKYILYETDNLNWKIQYFNRAKSTEYIEYVN